MRTKKETFSRWAIGRVNGESGEIDQFVDVNEGDYISTLEKAALYETKSQAFATIAYAGENSEQPVEVTITMEAKI